MTITFTPATREAAPAEIPDWVYEHRLMDRCEVDENGCWRWQGPLNPGGYGSTVRAWHRGWLPHRLAYRVMVGDLRDGMQIDHLCRTRNCINPEHLEQVSQAENLRRQGAAVTHCPRGHAYTHANTYFTSPDGRTGRACKRCALLRNRRRAQEARAWN